MENELTVKKQTCQRCTWQWYPRVKNDTIETPTVCPKCHSPYWQKLPWGAVKSDIKTEEEI